MTKTQAKAENPFLNILLNVVLPVIVLNKLSDKIGATNALLLALAFPLGYGFYDLYKRRTVNPMSVLGLLNVGITGGFALLGVSGIWFAVKEAAFPALIGLFVLGSAFSKKPFISTILLNPQVMDLDLLKTSIAATGKELQMQAHLKLSTILFSLSFVFSALANFFLAQHFFQPISQSLSTEEHSQVLNSQIAQMTSWSYVVIMIPSMVILGFVIWFVFAGIKKLTQKPISEFMLK